MIRASGTGRSGLMQRCASMGYRYGTSSRCTCEIHLSNAILTAGNLGGAQRGASQREWTP